MEAEQEEENTWKLQRIFLCSDLTITKYIINSSLLIILNAH